MVTRKCGIVGVAGNAFSIGIDTKKSVNGLKVAMTQKNLAAITCDSKELQLFMAKKDSVWLTERDLMDGLTDTNGMTQLEDSELCGVGFSEDDDLRVQLTARNDSWEGPRACVG
ncbi:hypothetical protein ON010_g15725 [Phytophthora cinnamomi]|nr:hypothetical protein ON010_g15725 [Phytophthora cinnamomi]